MTILWEVYWITALGVFVGCLVVGFVGTAVRPDADLPRELLTFTFFIPPFWPALLVVLVLVWSHRVLSKRFAPRHLDTAAVEAEIEMLDQQLADLNGPQAQPKGGMR